MLLDLEDYDQALKSAQQSLQVETNAMGYAVRAKVYDGMGQHERALADINRAISLDSNAETWWYELRDTVQRELGRHESTATAPDPVADTPSSQPYPPPPPPYQTPTPAPPSFWQQQEADDAAREAAYSHAPPPPQPTYHYASGAPAPNAYAAQYGGEPKTNKMAIAALACVIIFPLISPVLGFIALREINQSVLPQKGKEMAIGAIIVPVAILLFALLASARR